MAAIFRANVRRAISGFMPFASKAALTEVSLTKSDKVYVCGELLVGEQTASLLAGEVGLPVSF